MEPPICTVTSTDSISDAVREIRSGGVVVFPTETVYGLGADATNALAVARIYEIKGRPHFNPLIVHAADAESAFRLAKDIPETAFELGRRFWPGPLTLVLPKQSGIPGIVTAGLDTVALRVPSHPVAQRLLQTAGLALAAPSANVFQSISPTRVEHARKQFGRRVSVYLDGGPCQVGLESTILGFDEKGSPELLRVGGTPVEALEAVLGKIPLRVGGPVTSPGQLPRHYSPRTKLLLSSSPVPPDARRWGLLCLTLSDERLRREFAWIGELSSQGDLVEAASRLFDLLHEADEAGLEGLLVVPVPERGLGMAVNDRLRRAATE